MKYEITTKSGKTFIVDDEVTMLWVSMERDLGKPMVTALADLAQGSMVTLMYVLWWLAKQAGQTELKTPDGFVEHELADWNVVETDPKDSTEASPEIS
jgi:hypothetical protein